MTYALVRWPAIHVMRSINADNISSYARSSVSGLFGSEMKGACAL